MTENTTARVSDLVRACYAAFFSQNRQTLEAILSDDFVFNSPQDDHINKAAYFERCVPNAGEIRSHQIEQLFVNGNEALVRYRAERRDGARFRNVEYFRIEGDEIKEVDVFFGGEI